MPVINNVPVIWPRTSLGSISFPLTHGDGVLLIFSERSLDEWLSNGGALAPNDPRQFDLSDAIAIPGLFSFATQMPSTVNNTDFVINFKNEQIIIRDNGDIEVGKNSLKKLVNENLQNLFNNHVHNFVGNVGGATTIGVTGTPASATGSGAISVGACPSVPPTGLLGDSLGSSHLTTKVKAE
jgi:hypothetical protein